MGIKLDIPMTLGILLVAVIVFGVTDIDIYVQDMLYDFRTHTWVLDRDLQPWKYLFYDGIKRWLIILGVAFLSVLAFGWRSQILRAHKQGLMIVVLSAILVPLTVGTVKKSTNMPCPKNELRYGGEMIRTAVWQKYPQPFSAMPKIACWPAGHASGGFALLSLFFLFRSKRYRVTALLFALVVGWSMGIYKMLIGDHFLSHTLITMILSWLTIILIRIPIQKRLDRQ